jgi:hypothetical protein
MSNPNCMNCKHFYITWDQNAPRGCKLYAIKSKQLPSIVIASTTKEKECLGYDEKVKSNNKSGDGYGD